ncbi:MAG TPA: basic amino acid/polyamine antiporter [Paracoccus sp. (in: a-proteobacteria)]|uniref:basic amino acid/polyamine antiporter n=1 Tax=Paracoccus sp. TaxID=267 RepID=UPI002CF700DA|nr:basic amino acid/polyamine antiporter [Paracoccus sp. (in: a-proteobacteria)]HWL58431.1 basic amino acid/polyamine antiporter [Paracoccus sp. (in: a-proteobacteria)]
MTKPVQKIALPALTAMVVGSMVGAGIFNLPERFGLATGPFGAIIAWCIAGAGMYTLARVIQMLAERRPEIDAGIFGYAKAGFGNYTGFISAFGYWLSAMLANAFYWVLIGATLGTFFPIFGNGNTPASIALSLVGIWAFHFMILKGVEEAAYINTVVTITKLVPILVALAAMMLAFNWHVFAANFWGGTDMPAKPLIMQVKDTMLITVFVFIGIEGASVYLRYARSRADVGRATILGFACVTGMMVLVTLLPFAILPRAEVAILSQPSLAGALAAAVGAWGRWFISIAVIVSVLGAYLTWSLIVAEVPFAVAKSNDMPRFLGRESSRNVPANAMWVSNGIITVFLISSYWAADAFNFMLDMAAVAVLPPYLLVAAYGVLLTRSAEEYSDRPRERRRDFTISVIATIYCLFMFLAAGIKMMILLAVLLAPGTLLYIWARREQNLALFARRELPLLAVVVIAALIGMAGILAGTLSP